MFIGACSDKNWTGDNKVTLNLCWHEREHFLFCLLLLSFWCDVKFELGLTSQSLAWNNKHVFCRRCLQCLALGLMRCCVWVYRVRLSLRALTPMAGPSAALNCCIQCSVASPLSAAALECYLCCGHLCRACLFRGVCLCSECVQTLNPLLLRVPTMDIFYNRSDELLQRARWVVELADALTECHICRSVGFFVPCSSCNKPTCIGCQGSIDGQCNWCCIKIFKLQFVR